ncbi:MAG: NUDIX hydrolase, partial [Bradyrhizobium sp.]
MESPLICRVTALDLALAQRPWAFADERRAEIDAHFAEQQRLNPSLWNGRVLLGRDPVFADARLSASYFETDFASFLAWRDWGFP